MIFSMWLWGCVPWPGDRPELVFAVMGDVPYDPPGKRAELDTLRRDVAELDGVDFLVHLGDLKRGYDPCTEATYTNAADAVCLSPVPAFVLPGDNEWNDCERSRDRGLDMVEAWERWDDAFGPSAERCPALEPPTAFRVRTQRKPEQPWWPGDHSGAFAMDRGSVRVLGVTLPSFTAPGHGLPGERGQQVQDLAIAWVERELAAERAAPSALGAIGARPRGVSAAVILLHADAILDDSKQERFVAALHRAARAFGRPVLVLTGDSHRYREERPFSDADLTWVVVTRGGREAPLTVEVRPREAAPFRLVRGERHTDAP